MEALRFHEVRLRFHPSPKSGMPYFVGSQIRGALGYALKRTVCINPAFECNGCFAQTGCLYHEWYEKKESYHPYRLDIVLGKPYYDVGVFLFGKAVERLPYVVSAIDRMLVQNGLGKERKKVADFELLLDGKTIRKNGNYTLSVAKPCMLDLPLDAPPKRLKIRFITPLRIKYQNRFVRTMGDLHLHTLIGSIYRRYESLTGGEGVRLPFRVTGEVTDRFGTFKDLTRFSSRQKGKLLIGGMVGEMEVAGIDAQSYRLLRIAETIGAGKQTVFGLGKIKVDLI